MNGYRNFQVTVPEQRKVVGVGLIDIMACILVIIVQVIFNHESPILMIIVFCPFCLLGIYLIMAAMLFRVQVMGGEVMVRNSFGKKYEFHISDVERVDWVLIKSNQIRNGRIKIVIRGGKKLSVEPIMVGYDEMTAYILENVAESKIKKYIRNVPAHSEEM